MLSFYLQVFSSIKIININVIFKSGLSFFLQHLRSHVLENVSHYYNLILVSDIFHQEVFFMYSIYFQFVYFTTCLFFTIIFSKVRPHVHLVAVLCSGGGGYYSLWWCRHVFHITLLGAPCHSPVFNLTKIAISLSILATCDGSIDSM